MPSTAKLFSDTYQLSPFSLDDSKAKGSVLYSEILQNVTTGKHRQCGDSDSPILIEQFTDAHSGHGVSSGGSENSHSVDLRIELQVS